MLGFLILQSTTLDVLKLKF